MLSPNCRTVALNIAASEISNARLLADATEVRELKVLHQHMLRGARLLELAIELEVEDIAASN